MIMKIKYIVLCLLLALVGCQREEDMEIVNATINNERIDPSYSSVSISCNINCNATVNQVKAYISTTTDFSNAQTQLLAEQKKGTYAAKINGLANNTTYYVCYKISNNYSSFILDKTSQFKTIPYTIPTVSTTPSSEITHNSAIMGGKIVDNGGLTITNCGVVYSKSPNPTIENGTKVESNITKEAYTCTLTNLDFATTYYARAYAVNKNGIAYGEEVSFKTNGTTASLDTLSISGVTATSAVISGALINDGGESITALGICYGVNQSPTLEDATVINAELDGLKFSVLLNDLQKGTTYYVRAYVTNSHGTVYSDELYFNTEMTIPAVTTAPATDISYTSATVGGNVTDAGGANVTERGICYSTSANPTTANTKITSGSGLGEFTCNLTDLQDGTTYYVRVYAINAKGTAYGEEVSFTTKTKTIATVATTPATNVSYTSATVGGNVTNDGGASVTERGICYSTSANPTTANTKITSGSGLGELTCNLTDLQDGMTYYARAYAINAKGTAYGEEVRFTTKTKTIATVATMPATNVFYTSAMVGGNVTDDGGVEVIERGVVYSTSQNPTTEDSKVVIGSGLGEFTCSLTNLQDGTTYYARAYAVNAKGMAYGEEVSFTTKVKTVATVITSQATNISYTSATVGGNVTDDGGLEVTERGIVYDISQNPTTSNTKVINGSGLGEFTCYLTDLQEGTTYYARAYAINAKGTAYGEEVTFTTTELKVGEGIENGYVYVDLGLSVKWATMNVGASKPEGYGGYYAWGETTTKSTYDWSTYKYCNGIYDSLTKYNRSSSYGTVDNKTQLELSDDAARANWGGPWRMPTDAEWTELREQCTWTWTTQNGVNGYKVTSKSNGNSIFLPAAGCRYDSSLNYEASYGYYWSSSLYTDNPHHAWYVYFNSSRLSRYNGTRNYGRSVRPVCP